MTPVLNKPLPEFEAVATSGVKFTPQGFHRQGGGPVLLSQGSHPGCTTEAMQFRGPHRISSRPAAVVFGVSRRQHGLARKVRQNLELPFDLIADTEEKLCPHVPAS